MKHEHDDGRVCYAIHTFEEIAKELGITRQRVQQIEAIALRKLRHNHKVRELYRHYVKGDYDSRDSGTRSEEIYARD